MKIKIDNTLEQNIQDILDNNGTSIINAIMLAVYPVGSIYMSVNNTNPGTLFGGTWVAWGSGQVPVGVKTTDSDFATVEKTGGSKTASTSYTPAGKNTGGSVGNHTITTTEMPSHSHGISRMANSSRAEKGGCWVGDSQFHIAASRNLDAATFPSVISNDNLEVKIGNTGGGGAHNHGFTQPTFTGTAATITESTIQPYITCYMWKRTA